MRKITGVNCIILAMSAFAGLGLEVLLAFGIEPMIYGDQPMDRFTNSDSLDGYVYLMGGRKLEHHSVCKEKI